MKFKKAALPFQIVLFVGTLFLLNHFYQANRPCFPGRTKLESINRFDYGFQERKTAWTLPAAGGNQIVRIPFIVGNETETVCRLCRVRGGIPFPLGELNDVAHLRLLNAAHEEIYFKPLVLSRWVDGSIKWLAPNFETTILPNQTAGFFLDYGPEVRSIAGPSEEQEIESAEDLLMPDSQTLLLRNNPYWMDATGVMGRLLPVNVRYASEERFIEQLFEWASLNPQAGNWNEGLGMHTGAFVQFARSGQIKYFEFGESIIWETLGKKAQFHNILGLLHFYHLAGEVRVLNRIKAAGESYLTSEQISGTKLWGCVLLYEFLADERYKKAADEMIEKYLLGKLPLDEQSLNAFAAYHELTQDERVKEMLLKQTDQLDPTEVELGVAIPAVSYSYFLTRDLKYLQFIERQLQRIRRGENNAFFSPGLLATLPYAFAALEQGFIEAGPL